MAIQSITILIIDVNIDVDIEFFQISLFGCRWQYPKIKLLDLLLGSTLNHPHGMIMKNITKK
jgi:hypothetical protein